MPALCRRSALQSSVAKVSEDPVYKKKDAIVQDIPFARVYAGIHGLGEQYPDLFHDALALKEAHHLQEDQTTIGGAVSRCFPLWFGFERGALVKRGLDYHW